MHYWSEPHYGVTHLKNHPAVVHKPSERPLAQVTVIALGFNTEQKPTSEQVDAAPATLLIRHRIGYELLVANVPSRFETGAEAKEAGLAWLAQNFPQTVAGSQRIHYVVEVPSGDLVSRGLVETAIRTVTGASVVEAYDEPVERTIAELLALPETQLNAVELQRKYEHLQEQVPGWQLENRWAEHPTYTHKDWALEVSEYGTLRGYWHWVELQLLQE